MHRIDLSPDWRFRDVAPGDADIQAASRPGDDAEWRAIDLPGDINAALVRQGRMPDPHFADQARQCYWVTAREWLLRREFAAPQTPGEACDLVLEGIDGMAEVYVNGRSLGRVDNAFRPWRFDVAQVLRDDAPNVLLLRFLSIDELMGGPREDELKGWGMRRTWLRKPQFNFGWDWALPLPGIGVAGRVRLEAHDGARLRDVAVRTWASGRVDFDFETTGAARDARGEIRLRVAGHGFEAERLVRREGRVRSYCTVRIDAPRLWWPNEMGEQALYDYYVDLLVGGRVCDSRAGRFGLREMAILEEPFTENAGPGRSFWLTVNSRRVFAKGGNWIPTALWPAEARDADIEFLLRRAGEAHFNMMRVWGGGIYESDRFYELCDELGILVWQDFMFASAGYSVERLRDSVIAEASYQIRRLRNHPSVGLWCGINEDVFSWNPRHAEAAADAMEDTGVYSEAGDSAQPDRLHDDPILYTMILRGLVDRYGLGVPYVESSPQSHDDFGNTPESGNCHISCWKYALMGSGERYDAFREHFEAVCSFDSEFCIQGPPCEETMRAFLGHAHAWPPDDVWTFHIQKGHANLTHWDQTMRIAGATFGEIDSIEKYVKHGQATHAEHMRAEFESARRDRPNNGGAMMWMFNDCWPTANWSIIDYYRRPKPSYYAARRACAPVLPIVFERAGRIAFFLSNDSARPIDRIDLRFGVERLDGSRLDERSATLSVDPISTVRFHEIARESLDCPADAYLFIDARADGCDLPRVSWFPNMWRNVPWPEPTLSVEEIDRGKDAEFGCQTRLAVGTDVFARMAHLIVPEGAGAWWADDNYFDLPAGCVREVIIRSERAFEASALRIGHWARES